jgi:hypothetical protein
VSLPRGVQNRPAVVESHPQVVVDLLGWMARAFVLVMPLLVLVASWVPGTALRYECTQLHEQISQTELERRRLYAERARLLEPERLRVEAERLGLSAPLPGDGPWPVSNTAAIPRPAPAPPAPAAPPEPGAAPEPRR